METQEIPQITTSLLRQEFLEDCEYDKSDYTFDFAKDFPEFSAIIRTTYKYIME